jgi:type II secretory pathway pseudopilin PulG
MSATHIETRRFHREDGFTIVELLVASLIMITVTGAIFSLMNPARGSFQTQPQVSDVQQRLRVGIDSIQKDLVMAGAGTYAGPIAGALNNFMAPIMPYKAFGDAPLSAGPGAGAVSVNPADPELGIYFRDDAVSLMYVPPTPSQTTISQEMPQPSAELKVNPQPNCPGNHLNQLCGFETGDRLIIYDQTGNWDVFTVTQVQNAAAHLQHRQQTFSTAYAIGANVTAVRTVSYYHYEDPANDVYQLRPGHVVRPERPTDLKQMAAVPR